MKSKTIYTVVHANGEYSDYCESVVGVTDSLELAIKYAKQEADLFNRKAKTDKYFAFYEDEILIRSYPLNQFARNLSKAEKVVDEYEDTKLNERTVFQLDGNGEKFVPTEELK